MNKTELRLIELASASGGHYAIECGSGRGPYGGRVSYGERERAALFKLVDAGVIEILHRSHHNETNRGYTVRMSLFSFRLINK